MREEIIRDEYFDRDEANEAVQWTCDIAGELVELGFRVTQITLQSIMDSSGFLVTRYHSRVSGWREVDEDDEPSLMDAFDMKLTPYTGTVTIGDHMKYITKDWPVTTADLDTRDHYAYEPLPTNPEAAAQIWGDSFRALHPTQEDRIEKKLVSLEEMLEEILRQLSTGVTS